MTEDEFRKETATSMRRLWIGTLVLAFGLGVIFGLVWCGLIASAHAQPTKSIAFLVDVSSSVQPAEYELQKRAYVRILRDPEVTASLNGAAVAIAEYCGGVVEWVIGWTTDYDTAAVAYQRAPRMRTSCNTSPLHAIYIAAVALSERPGERIIDIAGDEPTNHGSHLVPPDWVLEARSRLGELGVTANGLIFGTDSERRYARAYYERVLINGFVVEVGATDGFAAALKRKIVLEIS